MNLPRNVKLKNVSNQRGIINLECNRNALNHCPLCHGENVALINTHTPYYWIECECGLQFHDQENRGKNNLVGHTLSAVYCIEKWNELKRSIR